VNIRVARLERGEGGDAGDMLTKNHDTRAAL
jgi:hypothetical protein